MRMIDDDHDEDDKNDDDGDKDDYDDRGKGLSKKRLRKKWAE